MIKKLLTILAILLIFSVYPGVYAQKCGITTYLLDVDASYDKNNNSINVYVINPKPLKSEGKELSLTDIKISVYQGKGLIKEKIINDLTVKPAEKVEFRIDNLTEEFGKDIVSIVVSAQTTSTPKLEVGSFNISLSKSVTTGVACGDDVLSY